jgi:hypothetical protein
MSIGLPIAFSSEVDTGSRQEKRVKARIESPVLIQSEPKKGSRDSQTDWKISFPVLRRSRHSASLFGVPDRQRNLVPDSRNPIGRCNLWDAKPLKIKGINKELAIRCDIGQLEKYGSMGSGRRAPGRSSRALEGFFYAVVEKQFCGA